MYNNILSNYRVENGTVRHVGDFEVLKLHVLVSQRWVSAIADRLLSSYAAMLYPESIVSAL